MASEGEMHPDSGDICTCGHSYGDHTQDTIGPCSADEQYSCGCPHWRQPIADMAGELAASIAEEAHIARWNPAAHDAYQLALQHLEPLRAAIARARKAEEGNENE